MAPTCPEPNGIFAIGDAECPRSIINCTANHPYFANCPPNQIGVTGIRHFDLSAFALTNNFKVRFLGQTAHGAADPWNGRSALDAVELMNHAVNMLREHVKPSTRIHYVISNGGGAPNVVPDRAEVWYFVRDLERAGVSRHTREC